jgi:hypothetical protein
LIVYPPLAAVVAVWRDPVRTSIAVTVRPGTATAESAADTTPAIVPPADTDLPPTMGPG